MKGKSFEELTEQYQTEKRAGAPTERMIELLLDISQISYEERWLYELALWYWKAGEPAKARRICKQLRIFFRDGPWVERADETIELLALGKELPIELEERYLAGKKNTNRNSWEDDRPKDGMVSDDLDREFLRMADKEEVPTDVRCPDDSDEELFRSAENNHK